MTRVRSGIIIPLFIGFMATTNTPAADAAIKSPACPELAALGQQIVPGKVVPINATPSRFTLPAAFVSPSFEQMYGAPALAWSPDDMAAAIKQSADCIAAAKKARNAAETQALANLWRSLGALRATLGSIAVMEPRLDATLKALLEDPPSRGALDALMAAASVRDGSANSMQKAAKDLRDSAYRLHASDPALIHAETLFKMLSDVPAKSWGRVFPPIDKRIVEVRQWVIDDVHAQINATPETLQGLQGLGRLLQKARTELAVSLSEAELAQLDVAAKTWHEAIEDALAAQEAAKIDAIPATAEGLNQLRLTQQSQVRTALSPARVAALDQRIAARREAIGSAVTDEQMKRLDAFPSTMAGLTDLDAFKNRTIRDLEALAGAAAAARFGDAATKRATAIGDAAFGPFHQALGEMPATEEGLAELDNALAQITGPIDGLKAPVQARYVEAAAQRREEIVRAVEKENARLAKLPLSGSIFVDRETQAKLEFRNRSRLYLTMFDQTVEAEYGVDGDRVIIRLPNGNQVFTRQGAWIRGQDLNFKRQTDK